MPAPLRNRNPRIAADPTDPGAANVPGAVLEDALR